MEKNEEGPLMARGGAIKSTILGPTTEKGRIFTVPTFRFTLSNPSICLLALVLFAFTAPGVAQEPHAKDRAFLGLETQLKVPGDESSGLVVVYVFPKSAALEMGFQVGDEILTLNDLRVMNPAAWRKELQRENVNAKLRFQIRRKGKVMKVKGRIGSRQQTLSAYQEKVRGETLGKPLPPLPAALWWNTEKKGWEERENGMDFLRGKVAVVISFDSCKVCRTSRLERIAAMKNRLDTQGKEESIAFAGIFFQAERGRMDKEANLASSTAMFTSFPPSIPVAVAYYPNGQPTPEEKDRDVLIHHHGLAVLDTKGNVQYIQTLGLPDQEFFQAYRKAIEK